MRDRQIRAAGRIGDRPREIAKKLRSIHARSGHHLGRIWDDWISAMAIELSLIDRRPDRLAARVAEGKDITDRHGLAVMSEFAEMFALLVLELEEQRVDVLGQLYMSLELGNDHAGQFFTPPALCELMARMTMPIDDLRRTVDEKGWITIHEPAIGGGATIYPMIDLVLEAGLNPSEHMHVTGVDIDVHVLRMSYVQLSLLGVPAILCHGDTLRMQMFDDYFTFAHVVAGWGRRLQLGQTGSPLDALVRARALVDAVATEPALEPTEPTEPERAAAGPPKQGSLFEGW